MKEEGIGLTGTRVVRSSSVVSGRIGEVGFQS